MRRRPVRRRQRATDSAAPMRYGINLRGDLAKLDDAEIASRYEALIAEKVARDEANPRRRVRHRAKNAVASVVP